MRRIRLKTIPYDQNSLLRPNLKIRENRNFQKKSKNLKKKSKKSNFQKKSLFGQKFSPDATESSFCPMPECLRHSTVTGIS